MLERSAIDARAQIKAAENDVRVWEQTQDECERAVRAKEADVAAAKERVKSRGARVVCNAETVRRLGDGLAALQAEFIRSVPCFGLFGAGGMASYLGLSRDGSSGYCCWI